MILDIDKKPLKNTALKDSGGSAITYGNLCERISEDVQFDSGDKPLVFILCKNCCAAVTAFLLCLEKKAVPLLLDANIDAALLSELIRVYSPSYCFVPSDFDKNLGDVISDFAGGSYKIIKTGLESPELYSDLSFLLSTSGSTGSPKLVRHSYKNITANARNVAAAFDIQPDERALAALPIHFTQGLSTVCANLYAGATVLLADLPLTSKEFWNFIKIEEATSFSGVPYSYEILDRLRFYTMNLPHLTVINQGGGRLTDEMFKKLADYAKNKGGKFIATYGATETTSRMAYLPPELAGEKTGSIGLAMPGGKIKLIDEDGAEISETDKIGELVYSGGNVTLGYAVKAEDLSKGDERCGIYQTGDLAKRDKDGCLYIVGRKSRFVKLFGYRVSLDEIERIVKHDITPDCACTGNDKRVYIFVVNQSLENRVLDVISQKTGIHASGFEVKVISEIPKSAAGKTRYAEIEAMI